MRMEKLCDFCYSKCVGVDVGARRAGLNISDTADLLRSSCTVKDLLLLLVLKTGKRPGDFVHFG